ncbi:MAG: FAD-binding oxidoreductase [Acidimicrobiales bacterium]|jgi:FAD/FMN-containing dehydrogenase|nr:FAD-binding oxidoreductase [Acidimicrobiales bacterium]
MATRLSSVVRNELLAVTGPAGLSTDPEVIAPHVVDWTGRFRGSSPALVSPGSTGEVAAVVTLCRRHGLALVPQGGNTGLVGGATPHRGELVLSLRRLADVGAVEPLQGQITVGAGAPLGAVQAAVAEHGLTVGVDLAARDSATIGGMVATNAGGLRVVRHGSMRHQVVGHEAVLGTGAVVRHLGGLVKDNTGYDLGGLLCGSEGTLGVVTSVRLALVPRPRHRTTALCAFADAASAVAAASAWRREVAGIEALELFGRDGLEAVLGVFGGSDPFAAAHRWYVLVEAAGSTDPTGDLADGVAGAEGVADVAVAEDAPRAAALWRLREEQTAAIATHGVPHKLDVTLPLVALAEFLDEVPAVVAAVDPAARTWLFGHVGDGNVHVNVTGTDPDDETVDDAVLGLVARSGGSISAEHGIGVAKNRWLHLARSPEELEAFRALRRAFDPDAVLNPEVLVPRR